jgi:hypothetical protein
LDRLVSRLKVHQPIAVDEHGQIHPAGDAIAHLAAELQHIVTRYYWLTELAGVDRCPPLATWASIAGAQAPTATAG